MKKSTRNILILVAIVVGVVVILANGKYLMSEGFQSSKPWTRADKIDDLLDSTRSEIAALNAEIQKTESERQAKVDELKKTIDSAVKDLQAKITSAKNKKEAIKKEMASSVKVLGDRINGLNADERQGKIDANGRRKRTAYIENKKQIEALIKTV